MTDAELRKEILERVYRQGCRYVARDITGEIYAYDKKPQLGCGGFWEGISEYDGIVIELTYFGDVFPDLRMCIETLIDISKELKIVDWAAIPIDTPVLVSNDQERWERRYYAGYNDDGGRPFKAFTSGRTSWSAQNNTAYTFWEYCELANMDEVK